MCRKHRVKIPWTHLYAIYLCHPYIFEFHVRSNLANAFMSHNLFKQVDSFLLCRCRDCYCTLTVPAKGNAENFVALMVIGLDPRCLCVKCQVSWLFIENILKDSLHIIRDVHIFFFWDIRERCVYKTDSRLDMIFPDPA